MWHILLQFLCGRFMKEMFRIYLTDIRIPLIISMLLSAIQIYYNVVSYGYQPSWCIKVLINWLPILVLLIPLVYKLWKRKWKDAILLALAFVLLFCYFIWFDFEVIE